jgi:long-chain acyl-CoA synthetase
VKFAAFLASHASLHPEREAVVCGATRWTFAELEQRTNALAAGLQAAGLAPGERVAIVLSSNETFVETYVAVVKAGAIAVTINTRLADPEIQYILADSAPRFVFVAREFADKITEAGVSAGAVKPQIVGTDFAPPNGLSIEALKTATDGAVRDIPVEVDDCMICYTSGTTGFPKGAIITQSNYITVNGFMNAAQWGLSGRDRQIVVVSLAHRAGFARLANMIMLGSTLVIMPKFDPEEAATLIERERITVFGIVPTVGRMMLEVIERSPQNFATVEVMVVTGEAFPLEVKRRLHQALPHVRMYSFFAQTEAGGVTNLGPAEQFTHPHSVGRVNPGLEVRLVNDDGDEVAPGEVGELLLRSGEPGRFITMKGYFNRPKDTAEALQDGWLRTGDLGRFDADKYLYIVDRKKDMVLTGGYNVYSKEVEAVLLTFPGVRDAAVYGVPDDIYGEAVAAVVEAERPDDIAADALLEHCRKNLAGYKKPRTIKVTTALPRNSSGKVLKSVLRSAHFNI